MNDRERKRLTICQKAYSAGNKAGAIEAFKILTRNGAPLPRWLTAAVMEFIAAAIEKNDQPQRSSVQQWAKQHRADMRDYMRWDVVLEGVDSHGLKFSNSEAFRAAQAVMSRAETIGVHSIEQSYKRVQRRMKVDPLRYFSTDLVQTDSIAKKRARAGRQPDEMLDGELAALLDERDPYTFHKKARAKAKPKKYP